jgi:predicted nucleic acid-binding protein
LNNVSSAQRSGFDDCGIACIALQHHAPALTRNIKDISRVPGLKAETY